MYVCMCVCAWVTIFKLKTAVQMIYLTLTACLPARRLPACSVPDPSNMWGRWGGRDVMGVSPSLRTSSLSYLALSDRFTGNYPP